MPKKQFLALTAEFVDVADVIAISVYVIENNAAGCGPLDVFPQVLCREMANATIGLHRPIHSTKAFLCGNNFLTEGMKYRRCRSSSIKF